jgi:hypothetical protein
MCVCVPSRSSRSIQAFVLPKGSPSIMSSRGKVVTVLVDNGLAAGFYSTSSPIRATFMYPQGPIFILAVLNWLHDFEIL